MKLTCADPAAWAAPTEEKIFGGRYRIHHSLKRGNGVETLLGTDIIEDQRVVIKATIAKSLPAGVHMRLEHEAGVLRRIHSPFIAPLLHLGREADLLYLVMPFLEGGTLADRLVQGPLSVSDTITVGRCLLSALQEVHDQGVLHRDLKPANVIVDGDQPIEKATVIDFGLARSGYLDASIRDQPVGTARYMSPEQAGLLDLDTDERSDLYSAGVVLFECLAGWPPFHGDSVGEVLHQHMTVHPPELRSLGLAIPRALDEIIQRLLRKDPRDRYQSAAGVLTDLGKLADAIKRGVSDPALVVGLGDRRRTLTEPAFVGRDRELAALDRQLERAEFGAGGLVFLEAESGGGKTRLLVELAQRSARKGAWVLRGQSLAQEAQRPFQVMAGVAAEMVNAARLDQALGQQIREHLGDQWEAACAVLPELAEFLGAPSTEALGPETFGQVRSLQALVGLLDALGSPNRPAVVLLDDCQWAGEQTLKLLEQWQRRRDGERERHVLLVVAYRSEEVTADNLLRRLPSALRLKLAPFSAEDLRRLAESMAGPLPAEALAVVEQLSEGSPFMAAAVLQGMVESGALLAETSGWRIDSLAMADVQSSRHAAAFLARRIAMLPPGVLAFLSAGAVLGKEFDLDFAAGLACQNTAKAIAAVDEARRRQIVWAKAPNPRCTFVHDKLRQTLLERLQPEDRADLHRRAALHLESANPRRHFDLAYHFDAAGQSERALPYALAAGQQARAQHSLELAERLFRIAARGVPETDQATRFRISEGLGDILMLRGRYELASQQFEAALVLAQGNAAQAQIEGKIGELAFKRGDVKNAGAHIERALGMLGRKVPRWPVTFFLLVLWEVLVQFLHTLCPRLFVGRRRLGSVGCVAGPDTPLDSNQAQGTGNAPYEGDDRPQKELLAIRLYSRLAHLYWFHRGTVASLWAHLRELNLAERYPPTLELAQAYSEHAPAMSLLAYFRRGIAYAEKSLAIRQHLGDLWGQGQSLHFYGVVLYAGSRFREAIEKCRQAVRLLEQTGDYWEVNIARYQIAASLYRLGDLAGAVREAQRMHQSGLDLGDAQASGISLDVWARAALGRLAPETIQAEIDRFTGDVQRTAQVLLAQGVHLLNNGNPREAAEVLERAYRQVHLAGVKNAWVAPLLPWLATALRESALAQERKSAEGRFACPRACSSALLRQAWAAARRGLRLARKFQNELPHALRECALLCALRGRPRRGRRYFEESLAVAERQGAIYEHTQSLLARAQAGLGPARAGAVDEVAEAQNLLDALEAAAGGQAAASDKTGAGPVTLSLADRFDTVLDAGRRIASALSRQAIFSAVREAALKLLRGERCLILKVDGEAGNEEITVASGEIQADYSRTLVQRALAAGRAVASVEGDSNHSSESALLTGVRSALCAPICVRGRVAGCFYVSHRQVACLFREEEERLADFIATLAGAALENADGFSELHRLNQTLEQRIADSKRAENRIKEQAALLDKARDAITVVDLDDRILFWNQGCERMYGWTAQEAVGKTVTELLFQGPSTPYQDGLRAITEREEWSGELCQVTKAADPIIVESRWTLVRDDHGRPTSKLVVNTDISEKKMLEARFLRAQRLESLGTLAGGIAHDLNNVLTPILMGAEILGRDLPTEQRQGLLAGLLASAQRGADMVKQILSFARGMEGHRVPLPLKPLALDVEKMLRHTFPKSIDIRTALAGNLWPILADGTQLYQLLMNLCVNARDAMPEGGTLRIAAENVLLDNHAARRHPHGKPGPHVLITVEDTGSGIPQDVLDKIFDPFFTTKEFGKGTGLGLSTVLGIVKGHGGFINVQSTVGRGTQFFIYLPAAATAQADFGNADAAHLPRGQGQCILVVEDEASIQQITRKNLEAHGYTVLTARDGIEAETLYARHQNDIQLVLTDMAMPRRDGKATIQVLKKLNPQVRIIAVSGLSASLESAKNAGADFHAALLKPYTVSTLLKTVAEVLQGHSLVLQ